MLIDPDDILDDFDGILHIVCAVKIVVHVMLVDDGIIGFWEFQFKNFGI